jgi:hypothetical protein
MQLPIGGILLEVDDNAFITAAGPLIEAVAEAKAEAKAEAAVQALVASEVMPGWLAGITGGMLRNWKFQQLTAPVTLSPSAFQTVMSVPYTPQAADSHVLVFAQYSLGRDAINITELSLFRDTLNLAPSPLSILDFVRPLNVTDLGNVLDKNAFTVVDQPGSTSSFTYHLRARITQNIGYVARRHNNNGGTDQLPPGCSLLFLELAPPIVPAP